MPNPDTLAAQLARCVERFRDAGAKEAQKVEFRALMGLLQTEPLRLRDDGGGRVTVNGSPVHGAAVAFLVDRLALHGIAEITVVDGPLPAEVFELVKALAGQPGLEDVAAKIEGSGMGGVSVTRAPVLLAQQPTLPPLVSARARPALSRAWDRRHPAR